MKSEAIVISFPKTRIGAYEVITFPECFGRSQVFAVVYLTGSQRAIWETLRYETVDEAVEDARQWIQATAYKTYREASQAVLDGKARLKVLRKEGERAATLARRETIGSWQERLDAVQITWHPFHEQIKQVEAEIAKNYEIADANFDAWKGLNQ